MLKITKCLTNCNLNFLQNLNPIIPKLKYMEFKKNKLFAINNIDNDILNKDSQFLIGSITKLFTIFVVLKLQESKTLNVNNTLDRYFKNTEQNNFTNITIFDIMNHTSGIRMIPADTTLDNHQHKEYESCTNVVNTFINQKLFMHPAGKHNYSIIGYILLGKILEDVTGENYKKIFDDFIIKPIKLSNTFVGYPNIKLYNNNRLLNDNQQKEVFFASVTGGLCSSIEDLLKFSMIFSLLNDESKNILKSMYVFSEQNDKLLVHHTGNMLGGKSTLTYTYDKNFNICDVHIKLTTN